MFNIKTITSLFKYLSRKKTSRDRIDTVQPVLENLRTVPLKEIQNRINSFKNFRQENGSYVFNIDIKKDADKETGIEVISAINSNMGFMWIMPKNRMLPVKTIGNSITACSCILLNHEEAQNHINIDKILKFLQFSDVFFEHKSSNEVISCDDKEKYLLPGKSYKVTFVPNGHRLTPEEIASYATNITCNPTDELRPFLQENGSYLFDLNIKKVKGKEGLFASSPDMRGFNIHCIEENLELISTNTISASVDVSAQLNFKMNNVKVFFKEKNSDVAIDGNDKNAEIPEGTDYQIILVPEECDWRPKTLPIITSTAIKPPTNIN